MCRVSKRLHCYVFYTSRYGVVKQSKATLLVDSFAPNCLQTLSIAVQLAWIQSFIYCAAKINNSSSSVYDSISYVFQLTSVRHSLYSSHVKSYWAISKLATYFEHVRHLFFFWRYTRFFLRVGRLLKLIFKYLLFASLVYETCLSRRSCKIYFIARMFALFS